MYEKGLRVSEEALRGRGGKMTRCRERNSLQRGGRGTGLIFPAEQIFEKTPQNATQIFVTMKKSGFKRGEVLF